jgi:hypothetical protein
VSEGAGPGGAAVTRRGISVLALLFAGAVGLSTLSDALGLRWAEPQRWPTDLLAFADLPMPSRPAVVIVGSSRASMALIPGEIERCGGAAPPDPSAPQVYNLGRAYTTLIEVEQLARGLLNGPRAPRVLLVALDPEAIDAHNPRRPGALRGGLALSDVPGALVEARGLREGLAALRALTRGPEALLRVASGRHRADPRLGWLMRAEGGGQWCTGSPACVDQNLDFKAVMADSWERVEREVLPDWRAAQTPAWAPGAGPIAAAWAGLRAWAAENDVEIVVVELPFSEVWRSAAPPEIWADYADWIDQNVTQQGIPLYREPAGRKGRRADWLDPDHMSELGATGLSRRVCAGLGLPRPAAGG